MPPPKAQTPMNAQVSHRNVLLIVNSRLESRYGDSAPKEQARSTALVRISQVSGTGGAAAYLRMQVAVHAWENHSYPVFNSLRIGSESVRTLSIWHWSLFY